MREKLSERNYGGEQEIRRKYKTPWMNGEWVMCKINILILV